MAWLARAVPLLLALGIAGGIWLGLGVNKSHAQSLTVLGEMTCIDALGWDSTPPERDACMPVGLACNNLGKAKNPRDGREYLVARADLPEAVCVRERLGAPKPK